MWGLLSVSECYIGPEPKVKKYPRTEFDKLFAIQQHVNNHKKQLHIPKEEAEQRFMQTRKESPFT